MCTTHHEMLGYGVGWTVIWGVGRKRRQQNHNNCGTGFYQPICEETGSTNIGCNHTRAPSGS